MSSKTRQDGRARHPEGAKAERETAGKRKNLTKKENKWRRKDVSGEEQKIRILKGRKRGRKRKRRKGGREW